MTDIELAIASIDRLADAINAQAEAINGLLSAFALMAGEEFGTPTQAGDGEPDPNSTMDGEELTFRGARRG